MAHLIGSISTSHVPAIGGALARQKQQDPYWKPFFDAYGQAREWLAKARPDVVERIVAAIGDARMLLSSDPEKAAAELHKSFSKIDPDLFKESVVRYKAAFPDRGKFDQPGIDRNVALGAGAGFLEKAVELKQGVHWSNEFFK